MPLKENTKKYSLKTKATLANNDVLVGNIVKRTDLLMNIIQKTIISIQRYKSIDVLGSIELKSGLESLHRGFVNLDKVRSKIDSDHSPDELLDDLQKASNDISNIFRSYGTESMKDLLIYHTHSFRALFSVASKTFTSCPVGIQSTTIDWKDTTTVKAGYDDTLLYKIC